MLAGGVGLLLVTSTASAKRASTINLSVSSPLYAGATEATMTVSGTAAPGSYIQPWVNLKPAGAHCNADPHLDDGNEVDQASPDYANADGSYSYTWPWRATDTAGTFLLCAWLLEDGTVSAQTQQTVTVVKPPVTLSLSDVPASVRVSLTQTSFGTLHVDVGPTSRLVDWFENPVALGCPKDPSQDWLPSAEVSGKQTVPITERSSGLSGRYVLCVYVGDASGKDIDGMVQSGVIVVGCTVPNLTGKTIIAALGAVFRAGCSEGRVRYVNAGRAKHGRVVGQSPKPGTGLDSNTAIAITVGH